MNCKRSDCLCLETFTFPSVWNHFRSNSFRVDQSFLRYRMVWYFFDEKKHPNFFGDHIKAIRKFCKPFWLFFTSSPTTWLFVHNQFWRFVHYCSILTVGLFWLQKFTGCVVRRSCKPRTVFYFIVLFVPIRFTSLQLDILHFESFWAFFLTFSDMYRHLWFFSEVIGTGRFKHSSDYLILTRYFQLHPI